MTLVDEIQRLQLAKADIKSAIEDKGVVVGDGLIDTYAEKISEIGGKSFLSIASSVQFKNLNLFEQETVVLNLPNVTNFTEFLNDSVTNTTVEHLIINGNTDGLITEARNSFTTSCREEKLKRLTLNCDFSKASTVYGFCSLRVKLEIIDGMPLNFSSANMQISTINLPSLREIRFTPSGIPMGISFAYTETLSDESIQSIIDGLKDLNGSTSQKISFNSVVLAKLTTEQYTQIQNKNWNIG